MPTLSTHVLDTAQGVPARGVQIRLWQVHRAADNQVKPRSLIAEVQSDADGRVAASHFPVGSHCGSFELQFEVGEYFEQVGLQKRSAAFLDTVTLQFCLRDEQHYHVPLLVSPWSYSTYRGS